MYNARAVIFHWSEDGYTSEDFTITDEDSVRVLLGTLNDNTTTIHFENGLGVFTNPKKYLEIGHMTAHTTDRKGSLYYWGGDFIIFKDDGYVPISITDEEVETAQGYISSLYFKKAPQKEQDNG